MRIDGMESAIGTKVPWTYIAGKTEPLVIAPCASSLHATRLESANALTHQASRQSSLRCLLSVSRPYKKLKWFYRDQADFSALTGRD